jgi:very-short-patch-repair endonuclease
MKCENCEIEHDGSYGSGRFCSSKCARGFSTKAKRKEINQKVSEALTGTGNGNVKIKCKNCGKIFEREWRLRNREYCSPLCSKTSEEVKEKISKTQQENFKKGIIKGWASRKNLEPSYPEKFFMKVLDNNNIKYERELRVGKYFIDFAIKDKMIALEIDGKQHLYEDRIESDKRKDKFLRKKNWDVYRIPWKNINTLEGKIYIKGEIEKFLNYMRT